VSWLPQLAEGQALPCAPWATRSRWWVEEGNKNQVMHDLCRCVAGRCGLRPT
jgi:hypothetical protein